MDFKPMELPSLHFTLLEYVYIFIHTQSFDSFFFFSASFLVEAWFLSCYQTPWDPFLGKSVRCYNSHWGYQCYHWMARKKSRLTKCSPFFLSCSSYRRLAVTGTAQLLSFTTQGSHWGSRKGVLMLSLEAVTILAPKIETGTWHSWGRSGPTSAWQGFLES